MVPGQWATRLVPRLADGLDPEVVGYLEETGAHPALAELRTLAYAPRIDETAIWISPLPGSVSVLELPVPAFSAVREAAYAQIGAAVAAASRGRTEEATRLLREVVSAGLLMGEQGNMLLSNLIGFVLAEQGAEALMALHEATGRAESAAALRDELTTAVRVANRARVGLASQRRGSLAGMPEAVADSAAIRGMRWEFFITLSSLGPCINLNRSVFGVDETFSRWTEEVREGLVRTSGDEEFFDLARRGWFGSEPAPEVGIAGRLAGLVLADEGAANCVRAFRDLR